MKALCTKGAKALAITGAMGAMLLSLAPAAMASLPSCFPSLQDKIKASSHIVSASKIKAETYWAGATKGQLDTGRITTETTYQIISQYKGKLKVKYVYHKHSCALGKMPAFQLRYPRSSSGYCRGYSRRTLVQHKKLAKGSKAPVARVRAFIVYSLPKGHELAKGKRIVTKYNTKPQLVFFRSSKTNAKRTYVQMLQRFWYGCSSHVKGNNPRKGETQVQALKRLLKAKK